MGERLICARGARGWLILKLQARLSPFYQGRLDGDYGPKTEAGVRGYQQTHALPVTGRVDGATWEAVMEAPSPSLFDRCLQLIAAFEGHGFSTIRGNWDGAGLTWGILGFTLKAGSLRRIVLAAFAADPTLVQEAFGERTDELLRLMQAPKAEQEAWANRISVGASKVQVAEPWRSAFAAFGEQEPVQALQRRHALEGYFRPALKAARRYRLTSELGIALCFDIQVQNGGIGLQAKAKLAKAMKATPVEDERGLRLLLAQVVAEEADSLFQTDVMARKVCLATGSGVVHGERFDLTAWGLADLPAEDGSLGSLAPRVLGEPSHPTERRTP